MFIFVDLFIVLTRLTKDLSTLFSTFMKNNHHTNSLFSEFPGISNREWEEKIIKDLKGRDPAKLLWQTPEGFSVKPYYREDDLQDLEYLNSLPGMFPFLRGGTEGQNPWNIRQDMPAGEPAVINKKALEVIKRGVQEIGFDVSDIDTVEELELLLAGIDPSKTAIHFYRSVSYPKTLELFLTVLDRKNVNLSAVKGSFNFDPISYVLRNGDFYQSWDANVEEMVGLLEATHRVLPLFKVIQVGGNLFQDGGGTLVEELAFALASGNEYLAALTDKGLKPDVVATHMQFTFALGQNFFLEIAKLRAARILWATIVEQYHPTTVEVCKMDMHCVTAYWNMSVYDPYVNMLRTATEGMAGALGTADSITTLPFDLSFEQPTDFARRIARNQQLIFKEESHLDKVADPAAGSYLVENLTHAFATHAWKLFQEIEKRGGMIPAIREGLVQEKISASKEKKEQAFASRKEVMIGTNQYPNLSEQMLDKITTPAESPSEKKTTYPVIQPFRITSAFDTLRLNTEKYVKAGNKQPVVFLFTTGNLAMLRARAGFATNFFGCAGYKVIDNPGFSDLDLGIQKALDTQADIVVMCSSDETYPEVVPQIAMKLKARNPRIQIVVAGYPQEHISMLTEAGVDGFIHVKSNLLEELNKYQHLLGIR